jgi:perosamine synthetase
MSDNGQFIPLSVPHIRGRESQYVQECLQGEWVSSAGSFVDRFESAFAEYVGSRHAVACSSGSAALHVALLLADVRRDDLVLVPTLTFIATVNSIRYCGADPVFVDCDEYYNIDCAQVIRFIESDCERRPEGLVHRKTGRRLAALLPVHVFGNAVDIDPLLEVAAQHGIPMVEDAAESLGTRYRGNAGGRSASKHTGTLGAMGCFSFNGNKILTTGGGGMIVTDDDVLAKRAKYLTTQAKDDEVRFIHEEVGFNYRLTNVQAAIGVGQLEQMPEHLRRKTQIHERYCRELAGVEGLKVAALPPYADNNCWMVALQVTADRYGEDRERLWERLARRQIQTRPVWELSHRQRPYRACEAAGDLRLAEALHSSTLTLPSSVGLTEAQQTVVIEEILRVR